MRHTNFLRNLNHTNFLRKLNHTNFLRKLNHTNFLRKLSHTKFSAKNVPYKFSAKTGNHTIFCEKCTIQIFCENWIIQIFCVTNFLRYKFSAKKSSRRLNVTQFHVSLDLPWLLVVFQRDNSTAPAESSSSSHRLWRRLSKIQVMMWPPTCCTACNKWLVRTEHLHGAFFPENLYDSVSQKICIGTFFAENLYSSFFAENLKWFIHYSQEM